MSVIERHRHFLMFASRVALVLLLAITVATLYAAEDQKNPRKQQAAGESSRPQAQHPQQAQQPQQQQQQQRPQRTQPQQSQAATPSSSSGRGDQGRSAQRNPSAQAQPPAAPANQGRADRPSRPVDQGRPVDRNPSAQPPAAPANQGRADRPSRPVDQGRSVDRNPVQRIERPASQNPLGGFPGRSGSAASSNPRRPVPEQRSNEPGRAQTYRGTEAQRRPEGRAGTTLRSGDMTIHRGSGNASRIVVDRKDRTRIVTNRSGHGYVQRPFTARGREFVTRTYYSHGRVYARYYRPYEFHGMMLNGYVPPRYYQRGFYDWAYRPWRSPVYYSWGWMGAPWYGYYAPYFTPAAYYTSAGLWLTDYILSAQLADSYADRANAPPMYGAVPLSAGVKDQIAYEVEAQLAQERSEANVLARNDLPDPMAGFPRLLSDNNPHVFVMPYTLDVAAAGGESCTVGRGDVLRLTGPPPPDSPYASMLVIAAKPGSCRVGAVVSVSLDDLQDVYNQMRETVSQGLEELRSRAGQNGVPPLPAGEAGSAPVQSSFLETAPPADPQVQSELNEQVQAAGQVEQQPVQGEDIEPVTISPGQTIEQVTAILGKPKQVVMLGNKQIYVYPSLKITFVSGRVTDVE